MDEFDDNPKVTRLHVRGLTSAHESAADVRKEVAQLLAEADTDPVTARREPPPAVELTPPTIILVPDTQKGPPPHHRNATVCPQCDAWTWRATRECRYCYYDLELHAQRLAAERQRQWHAYRQQQLLRWTLGFLTGGLAAIYFSSSFPAAVGNVMVTGGVMAFFAALVCGKALDRPQ